MILQNETLQTIINAITAADTFKIEPLLITQNNIAGIDSNCSVAIFSPAELEIGCAEIGISSPSSLNNKFKLIDDITTCTCKYDDENGYAKYIYIKNRKIDIEYRCANTRAIKVPKTLGNDTHDYYQITIDEAMEKDLIKCKNAMKSKSATNKKITIMCDDNEIKYKLYGDDNNESLVYSGGFVELVDDLPDTVNFIYSYSLDYFFKVIKHCEGKYFLTKRGMIHFIYSGTDVYLMPLK